MAACLTILSLLALMLYMFHSTHRHMVILNLKPTERDFRLLMTTLDIRYTDELIMFSFIYRRRRLYHDIWAGLWFHAQKGEDEVALEYYHRLVDEALTDLTHLKSKYDAYSTMCRMEVGDGLFLQREVLNLIIRFKPFFESAFGKNGDDDVLVNS